MTVTRRTVLSALLYSTLLSGCVATRVTGKSVSKPSKPAQQLLVVVMNVKSPGTNIAGRLGQQNYDSLVPHLVERLPLVFSRNGLPARAVVESSADTVVPPTARPVGNERVLVVAAQSATYNSRSGQELFVSLKLLSEAPPLTPVWQGTVRMATLGFGAFDEKVANAIALQILEQLREGGLATVREGALQVE